jgi:hypothetical protein
MKSVLMKPIIPLLLFLITSAHAHSQIFTPVQKANFGVDGELRSNMFGTPPAPGTDDWFNNSTGSGQYVIDTTGAAAMVARYAWDMAYRRYPFYRTMRFPTYSAVNNKLLIDAVFIRDYHGDDTTAFTGSNKNADSPQSWAAGVTSVPDKNDILDMMVHVRRAGPTVTDSLWLFGGLSIDNVTGSRYFDFEMYQTDIYYDRPSRRFYGYGPDLGHTSWKFDATGNITVPGDIIFTAEYGGTGLSALEARIWVNKNDLAITPADFSWSGQFDGASAGSQYGYASIMPNSSGAYYTGVQNTVAAWPGPFGFILANNTMPATYIAKQFMEFSVNLTKLGLDPVTLLGGNACGMPFRRVLVKTRSSASFSAELKDFVGPFDLFLAPRADAAGDVTLYCGSYGISNLQVTNPVSTSTYTWTTADGNIVGSNVGPTITANMPGTYIVSQQLQSSCLVYATDTVLITYQANCSLLENNLTGLTVASSNDDAKLKWAVLRNAEISYFNIEYSLDGIHFMNAGTVAADADLTSSARYSFNHNINMFGGSTIYYRVVMFGTKGSRKDSRIVKLVVPGSDNSSISITPNPVIKSMQVNVNLQSKQVIQVMIYDIAGHSVYELKKELNTGSNTINIDGAERWPTGMYTVKVISANKVLTEKVIVH